MIHRLSRIVLAATVAALLGAPSAVFGATATLTAGTVAPPSGTTATSFSFSVRYDGDGKFEASAVTATVAGSSISLRLGSGTPLLGTWQAASRLPAGSWTVAFTATAAHGPQPSPLTGPLVRVTALIAAPTQTATLKASPITTPTTAVNEAGTPAPAPSAVPMPAPATTNAATPSPAADVASAGPSAEPSLAATTSGSMQPRTSNPVTTVVAPAAASPSATSAGAPSSTQAVRPQGSPSEPALAGLFGDDPQHPTPSIAFYVLAATAATTAGGAVILLLWRRRGDAPDAAPVSTPALGTATLPTRSIHGRHLEQADDPILESMGLNHPRERSRGRPTIRASASQVHRGPGVREPQPRGRR
jgi:hypothetical protein